ncbi:hypothetical protein [Gottfriedia acidiceleris]|uniref:hypothetical protein n=1 Tax=Gottfriedia acidiceleris TaxID=371036 RepID=UPI000B44EF65|nr:hypothetical protein [Gottfriedia acidiceleris]
MEKSNSEQLFNEFLRISHILNIELSIVPVLYGSLGLQKISGLEFFPQDIDILLPLEFLREKWRSLQLTVESLGYKLVDLNEHEFKKYEFNIAFSHEEDLYQFAEVEFKNLNIINVNGIKYKTLSIEEYLIVYKKSSIDGYRRTKKNNKDFVKINIIEELMQEKF